MCEGLHTHVSLHLKYVYLMVIEYSILHVLYSFIVANIPLDKVYRSVCRSVLHLLINILLERSIVIMLTFCSRMQIYGASWIVVGHTSTFRLTLVRTHHNDMRGVGIETSKYL